MAGLTLKLPVPKRQPIPRRLALPELPELTRTQRPSNPRRKSTPIVQDFRFQRRTPPVSTCEAPTLKPIIAKQTRKPSLKRKQVFPWSSSEDMETEPPSKRPKPRKNRKRNWIHVWERSRDFLENASDSYLRRCLSSDVKDPWNNFLLINRGFVAK